MAYPLEIKQRARTLYVEGGYTYEDLAQELNISLSQLKAWGGEGDWFAARTEFEKQFLELHSNVQRVKLNLSQKALQSGDPQLIYALSNLMRATQPKAVNAGADKATLTIEVLGKLLDYLKQRDSESLRYLEPHLRGFADSLKQEAA
ncbi:MAG: hypothetical protein AB7P69_03690 [Candidatus Binatia bacterium]